MKRSQERQFFHKPFTIVAPKDKIPYMLPDARIIEALVDLYSQESKKKGFPKDKCVPVVGKALQLGLGLELEDGKFTVDRTSRRPRLNLDEPHTWLKDTHGNYYELTGEQFNPGLDTKFFPGVTVICPGTDLYKRYKTRMEIVQEAEARDTVR
jgi:hypothetical protein